jgi:uncharacterized membrane protein YhaH (DUF805 family)
MDWNYLYTSFDGRIGRQSFWIGTLILAAVHWVGGGLMSTIFGHGIFGGLLRVVLSLVLLYPSLAVAAKRWHDRDKSGWWSLVALIPVVGWIWYLVECGILVGTAGQNRYGADPIGGPVQAGAASSAVRG